MLLIVVADPYFELFLDWGRWLEVPDENIDGLSADWTVQFGSLFMNIYFEDTFA